MLLTANGRSSGIAITAGNRWKKREVTANLRDVSCKIAKDAKVPKLQKVRIRAFYHPPDNRRRDSPNVLFLSSKAAIDGLVDAGVLDDDNDIHVISIELIPLRGEIVKGGQMVLEIEECR